MELKNISAIHGSSAGNGNRVRYTVLVNLVATALTVDLVTGALVNATVDGSVLVAKGDRIDLQASKPDGAIGSAFIFPKVSVCGVGQ